MISAICSTPLRYPLPRGGCFSRCGEAYLSCCIPAACSRPCRDDNLLLRGTRVSWTVAHRFGVALSWVPKYGNARKLSREAHRSRDNSLREAHPYMRCIRNSGISGMPNVFVIAAKCRVFLVPEGTVKFCRSTVIVVRPATRGGSWCGSRQVDFAVLPVQHGG